MPRPTARDAGAGEVNEAVVTGPRAHRLCRQSRRRQPQEKACGENEGYDHRTEHRTRQEAGIAEPPDHRQVGQAGQRLGDKGEGRREGDGPDIAMTDREGKNGAHVA